MAHKKNKMAHSNRAMDLKMRKGLRNMWGLMKVPILNAVEGKRKPPPRDGQIGPLEMSELSAPLGVNGRDAGTNSLGRSARFQIID